MDILGRERLREKLRTRENKNEHEAQSSGSQAAALAPQMDLFGEASRGAGKGIFSLAKKKGGKWGKKEPWHGLTQAEQPRGAGEAESEEKG